MTRMRLGVLRNWKDDTPSGLITGVKELDFPTCEIACWDVDWLIEENADKLRRACEEFHVEITAIWAGLPGKYVWNFIEGPDTIGLVPSGTREMRVTALRRTSDFAQKIGIPNISTHVGFIPVSPSDPNYAGLIKALRDVTEYCGKNGQNFLMETGQETPVTLLRTIEDVGMDNLGVCFDGANLLAYGTANPRDAIDVLGIYVRAVHAKDGEYPTSGRNFGTEKPLGQGRVNLPAVLSKLVELGYDGAITIEREVEEYWEEDVKAGKIFLEDILTTLYEK